MDKVKIKVRIDEALSFDMDIPTEMDIMEFSAIVERAKTISKASGASMVAGLKRGPKPHTATVKKVSRRWDRETELQFYKDYQDSSKSEKVAVLGPKYGLGTEGSISQTFYRIKKKHNLGKGVGRTGYKTSGFDAETKSKIKRMYESGNKAKDIAIAVGKTVLQVRGQIKYMKQKGTIIPR